MPEWSTLLEPYNDVQRKALENAAKHQAERIEKAALDPTNSRIQDGLDIGELWFAVLRRREELAGGSVAEEDIPEDAPAAPAEESEAEVGESPEEDASEPADAPEEPSEEEFDALVARAKELGLKGPLKTMKPDTLRRKIAEAEE